MYKFPVIFNNEPVRCVIADNGLKAIPFDAANSDYIQFKREINEGKAQLQDADGNVMSPEAAKAFVATLP